MCRLSTLLAHPKEHIKSQKRNSTRKSKASFDKSGKSYIYKINSGNYKNYKLTSRNCSTFVLDGLSEAYSTKIILYRFVQTIYYPHQVLDTPAKIYELCQWLSKAV